MQARESTKIILGPYPASGRTEAFTVDSHGAHMILDPGRYEAETPLAPIFDDMASDSSWWDHESPDGILYFVVDLPLRHLVQKAGWSLADDTAAVSYFVTDQGFIFVTELNAEDWAREQDINVKLAAEMENELA